MPPYHTQGWYTGRTAPTPFPDSLPYHGCSGTISFNAPLGPLSMNISAGEVAHIVLNGLYITG